MYKISPKWSHTFFYTPKKRPTNGRKIMVACFFTLPKTSDRNPTALIYRGLQSVVVRLYVLFSLVVRLYVFLSLYRERKHATNCATKDQLLLKTTKNRTVEKAMKCK